MGPAQSWIYNINQDSESIIAQGAKVKTDTLNTNYVSYLVTLSLIALDVSDGSMKCLVIMMPSGLVLMV